MKKLIIFIMGIIIGILLSIFGYSYLQGNKYITLSTDYSLPNGGILKKGTKVKYNAAFSEGFTQYMMYLNMSDGVDNDITTEKEKFMVIPYWIEPIKEDTISQNSCDSIFEIGEKMPMFIGGNSELMTYNWDKVIPLVGQSNNRTGILITKLHYSLIISKEGEVLDVEILTKVEEKRLEDELETELLNMPDWIPGEVNGKPECFRIRVPISCMKWQ